jgi:phosphinothricin acetyltransferase
VVPDLRIELATEADLPRIVEISNWAAARTTGNLATQPEPLEQWLESWRRTSRLHPWLVARAAGAVAGFAKSGPHRTRQAYDWAAEVAVYIDPACHGRGVGTALYTELFSRLRAQGYVTLLAGITSGNEASEHLHGKLGFTRCATFHRIGWKQDRWHDVGYWELHLQPEGYVPTPIQEVRSP